MSKPKKTPSGRWQVVVYLGRDTNGKRQYHKETFDTYKEACLAASRIKLENKTRMRSGLTVHKAMEQFIDSVDGILSPTTVAGYRQLHRNAYHGILHVPLEKLTTQMVQVCMNQYALARKSKTVRNALGLLRRVLQQFGLTHIGKITLPAKTKTAIVIPKDETVKRCLALTDHPGMRAAILLGAGAGMRRSEIAALEAKHINVALSTVSVEQALVKDEHGQLQLKSTKTTESTRVIEVMPEVITELTPLLKGNKGFLIGLTPDAITRRFGRVCKKANVKCRFHDLRHYHASYMLAAGIPDKYAMKRMGHATNNMLHTVYQHIRADAEKAFADKLNASMSAALGQSTV